VLTALVEVAGWVRRRWTLAMTATIVAADVAFVAIVSALAVGDDLVDPAFLTAMAAEAGWDTVPSVDPWWVVLVVGAVCGWEAVDTVRRHLRFRAHRPVDRSAALDPS